MKTNKVLLGILAGIIMLGLFAVTANIMAGMVTHGTFVATGDDVSAGNAEVALAIWGIVCASVIATLFIEGIVLLMFVGTIKRWVVAKIVQVAKTFSLELTPEIVWNALFEKIHEEKIG